MKHFLNQTYNITKPVSLLFLFTYIFDDGSTVTLKAKPKCYKNTDDYNAQE
jgi:hypothetical protein